MPPHFFLSYARPDSGPLVAKFFADICDYIRIISGLPRSEMVGFYEEAGNVPNSEWSAGSADALQSSRMMVCLLSPSYFHSERAGKEWQFFEMRRRESLGKATLSAPVSLAQIIKPVVWIPWEGSVPTVINERLAHPGRIHQTRALTTTLKTSGKSRMEYAEFVKVLAGQIIEQAEGTHLVPLESMLPLKEVNSAFHLWDEVIPTPSEDRNESPNQQRFVITDEFSNTPNSNDERAAGVEPSEHDFLDPPLAREQFGISSSSIEERPKIFIVEQSQHVNKLLVESLQVQDIDAEVFSATDAAWDKYNGGEFPDLYLVNVQSDSGNSKELDFIKEITDADSAISVIAISANEDELVDAVKAGAVALSKPPDNYRLITMMGNLAGHGLKRRLYQQNSVDDPRKRHVFLSYSSHYKRIATGLKWRIEAEDIGVWYAAHNLKRTEAWYKKVQKSVDNVDIFLALITEGYLESLACMTELTRFMRRLNGSYTDPLLILVLYDPSGNSEELQKDKRIKPIIAGSQYALDLSGDGFLDTLQVMTGRIQERVGLIRRNSG